MLIYTGVCTDGNIRLQGSTNVLVGRVEVCVNQTWATVCDKHWDDNDAKVICQQLGHSPYGNTTLILSVTTMFLGALAAYGSLITDKYPIRVYGVNCTGNERTLFKCPIHLFPQNLIHSNCSNNNAGVICQGKWKSFVLSTRFILFQLHILRMLTALMVRLD